MWRRRRLSDEELAEIAIGTPKEDASQHPDKKPAR